jgi:putative transferase (TIGR04331 family)
MNYLVTTSIERQTEQFGNLFLLGAWCEKHKGDDFEGKLQYTIINYHWDDRNKLLGDYDYLLITYYNLLDAMTVALNNYHNLKKSKRFWQIVIGPWLVSYISVFFDRFECINYAMKENQNYLIAAPSIDISPEPIYDYTDYIDRICSDTWNYSIFRFFLEKCYPANFTYIKHEELASERLLVNKSRDSKSSVQKKIRTSYHSIINLFDKVLKILAWFNNIVIIKSSMKTSQLLKLNFALKQVPRFYSSDFTYVRDKKLAKQGNNKDVSQLKKLNIDLNASNLFEKLIVERIQEDMPMVYLDEFQLQYEKAKKNQYNCKIIFTSLSHWDNELFKIWSAEKLENSQKCSLILCEHGAGFAFLKHHAFFHEEDIADVMCVTNLPYHPKHIQTPFHKNIKSLKVKNDKNGFCTFMGFQVPKYSFRLNSGSIGNQALEHFDQGVEFYKNLNSNIKSSFKVRYYAMKNAFVNSQRILNAYKVSSVLSESTNSYKSQMKKSRLIVSSYPQTNFFEAMSSGIPTILLFPRHLWQFDPKAEEVIEIMSESKIIFSCPKKAAAHVNEIWQNPNEWWDSEKVLHTRQIFMKYMLKLSDSPIKDWKAIFEKFYK